MASPGPEVLLGTLAEEWAVGVSTTPLRSIALISSICEMGVTPAIGSLENSPIRKASAPANLPSI